ncbi:hypothetical protein [Paenibacillus agilis]|uniref:Tubby C-terminal domain-containing protein n=1 Tax=Paenibacillus agilis TaxID=3020863 RepID=A0A559IC96_9BACL|nr:hypothetical protein [Paenibacillus agilis]TVX85244.1 hypothetical protein FPZ44_25315 [Paenibacillus agilis]
MAVYTYKSHFYKKSTKEIEILDENNNRIGSMQRYHKNKWMRVVDHIINEYEVNLEAFHVDGGSMINVVDITPLTKLIGAEWKIEHADGEISLISDKTKIKTNIRYELQYKEKRFSFTKDLGDRIMRLRDESDMLHAEITYDKMLPPITITIKNHTEEVDVRMIACVYYLYSLRT